MWWELLVLFGIYKFTMFVWMFKTSTNKNSNIVDPKLNHWAIITGGSDGIGYHFASQLAEKGYNLILIARTQFKLDSVAQQLSKEYLRTV
jgi:hypothetical protein